jgi:hypothetical protein
MNYGPLAIRITPGCSQGSVRHLIGGSVWSDCTRKVANLSELLLLFAEATSNGPISLASNQGYSGKRSGIKVENYKLADHQPVPVHLGLRPGSPYGVLTTLECAGSLKDQDIGLMVSGAGIRARWLYKAITEPIERSADPAMLRHIHLAFTNPADDREDEFNAWYSGDHLKHALLADGFVAAQRFIRQDDGSHNGSGGDPSPYRYLTVYDLRTDDLRESEDDMHRFASGEKPGMPLSDALGPVRATWVFTPTD